MILRHSERSEAKCRQSQRYPSGSRFASIALRISEMLRKRERFANTARSLPSSEAKGSQHDRIFLRKSYNFQIAEIDIYYILALM